MRRLLNPHSLSPRRGEGRGEGLLLLATVLVFAACARQQPTCSDGVRNGQESDVDCGGPECPSCELTNDCELDEDCASGFCRQHVCAPALPQVECRRNADCAGGSCVDGRCAAACQPPLSTCGPSCVDLRFDFSSCGRCGRVCRPYERCENGQCTERCPPGTLQCAPPDAGALCVDPQRDALHCGNCTTVCSPGQSCRLGTCQPDCAAFQSLCGGQCVSTSTDPQHCGGCDRPCDGGVCSMGACRPACAAPATVCDGGLLCVDTRFDPLHCGACGAACPPVPHARPLCINQQCTRTDCDPGFEDCDGLPFNGCEAQLAVDPLNCGVCRRACMPCFGGMCP